LLIPKSDKVFKVAIVGCGNIAGGYDEAGDGYSVMTHAKAYELEPHTKVVAAMDPDSNRLGKFCEIWSVPTGYSEVDAMMQEQAPDIVSICSPNEHHYAQLKQLVRYRPAAIFCEKPLALSAREAREMISLCRSSDVLLVVNYLRRWDPTLLSFGSRIRSGEFGAVQNGRVYFTKGVFHNASHAVNLLASWLGEGRCEDAWNFKPWGAGDFTASFRLSFSHCREVVFQHCLAENFNFFEIELVCEKAKILFSGGGQSISITLAGPSKLVAGTNGLAAFPEVIPGTLNRALGFVVENMVQALASSQSLVMAADEAATALDLCEQVQLRGSCQSL
jgi:predicted dehydrogenase